MKKIVTLLTYLWLSSPVLAQEEFTRCELDAGEGSLYGLCLHALLAWLLFIVSMKKVWRFKAEINRSDRIREDLTEEFKEAA